MEASTFICFLLLTLIAITFIAYRHRITAANPQHLYTFMLVLTIISNIYAVYTHLAARIANPIHFEPSHSGDLSQKAVIGIDILISSLFFLLPLRPAVMLCCRTYAQKLPRSTSAGSSGRGILADVTYLEGWHFIGKAWLGLFCNVMALQFHILEWLSDFAQCPRALVFMLLLTSSVWWLAVVEVGLVVIELRCLKKSTSARLAADKAVDGARESRPYAGYGTMGCGDNDSCTSVD